MKPTYEQLQRWASYPDSDAATALAYAADLKVVAQELIELRRLNDERIQRMLRVPDPDMEAIMKEIAGEDGDSLHDVVEYVRGLKAEIEEMRVVRATLHDNLKPTTQQDLTKRQQQREHEYRFQRGHAKVFDHICAGVTECWNQN